MTADTDAPAAQTEYLIQIAIADTDLDDRDVVLWRDVGRVMASGARKAKRTWAEGMPADFAGAHVRCIPVVNLNEGDVAPKREFDVS